MAVSGNSGARASQPGRELRISSREAADFRDRFENHAVHISVIEQEAAELRRTVQETRDQIIAV